MVIEAIPDNKLIKVSINLSISIECSGQRRMNFGLANLAGLRSWIMALPDKSG